MGVICLHAKIHGYYSMDNIISSPLYEYITHDYSITTYTYVPIASKITCSVDIGWVRLEGCQVTSCTTFLFTGEASLFDSSSPKQEWITKIFALRVKIGERHTKRVSFITFAQ